MSNVIVMTKRHVFTGDILVAGAGFAGSLMALILHSQGFRVCLVEKGRHPRFAIGESSTPIADMLLRRLSSRYNLPWLAAFSRYGSWQEAHPEIVCGIKRGFSYFKHYPGKSFATDSDHSNELLVAASTDDVQSDTNWLRADLDAFLVSKVIEAGIPYFDRTEIVSGERSDKWAFHTAAGECLSAEFFIDATGGGVLLDRLFGVGSSSDGFLTDSFAVFSHFHHVPRWVELLGEAGIPVSDFPYDPDHSALHQVLDEGWMWMLRFNDERISLGFALNGEKHRSEGGSPEEICNAMLQRYPTIGKMLCKASLSAQPGRIIRSGRLQRRTKRCFGEGWAALPHTAGFVDPLFSPGIAHSLTGLQKIAEILEQHWGRDEALYGALTQYEHGVFEELTFIDQLVGGCYKTMDRFELFNAWSMLYFAATITYEQRLLKGLPPGYFLGADDRAMRAMVDESYRELMGLIQGPAVAGDAIARFTATVRQRIAPVNIARLLDPALKNMYRHTAVSL